MQSRRRPRLDRNLHQPLRRTDLVIRHGLARRTALVQIGRVAKGRYPEAGNLQAAVERRGRGGAFHGDTAGGGLQGRDYGQGVAVVGVVEGFQCNQGGQSESIGEEGGGGFGAAGERWAADL